jgi:hypothetical protein
LVAESTTQSSSLQLSHTGIYIVKFDTPQGIKTQKVIVK